MPKSRLRARNHPIKTLPAATLAPVQRPRGERRKRETRTRLLEAALRLMAVRGMEGVAINEITEAADVGFGSFYNHFDSKEAIYAAVLDWVFEAHGEAVDRRLQGITDPAESIAARTRLALLRASREPVWGQFLLREGLSGVVLVRGIGERLMREIENGVKAKRFPPGDILMMYIAAGGTILASISLDVNFRSSPAALTRRGFSADGLPERTAASVLRILGLEPAEAEAIARRPLPSLEPAVEP